MTRAADVPALAVHGELAHGVALYATVLADAVAEQTGRDTRIPVERLAGAPRAHLHFTDRLWGASPEEAAARIERLARDVPLTVTVHDVPQESDGADRRPRRADCYRRVIAAARGVVVSSAHERALLGRHVDVPAEALTVIPLPVDPFPPAASLTAGDGSVGVLGFFYPGKGHAEAAAALAARAVGSGERQRLTVLGRASPGHEDELAAFVRAAEASGVDVDVTGFLPEADLVARCRGVSVPVVAHRHMSASGSLGFWIAAGRRPVVTANDYTREMAALRPGTTVIAAGALDAAVSAAFADPAATWIGDASTRPDSADAAIAHLTWWRDVVPW